MSDFPPLPHDRVREVRERLKALSPEELVRELAFQIVWDAYTAQVHEAGRKTLDLARLDTEVTTRIGELFETYGLVQAAQ